VARVSISTAVSYRVVSDRVVTFSASGDPSFGSVRMPPKRGRTPAAGISPREARLHNRSQTNEPAPPALKRSKSTPAFRRAPQVAPAFAQNQPQFAGDQFGALLQSVEALTAVVRAQSVQHALAPVASDNRRPADLVQHPVEDLSTFMDAGIDGDFDGVSVAEGMSHLPGLRSRSYSQLRACAQALEYVNLAGFLDSEVVASRKESFSVQSINGVLTMRAKEPKTIIRNMAEWGQAWSRFTVVLMEKFPELTPHLLKYQGFIFSLATDYHPAELAIAYDRAFRKQLGRSCSPAYNEPNNLSIFLSVFRTAIGAVCGLCASRLHSTENCTEIKTEIPRRFAKPEPGAGPWAPQFNPTASRPVQGNRETFCFGWNRSGVCGSKYGSQLCRFAHKCERCRGSHQSRFCTSASTSRTSAPRA
jgi:hypothetical protein